MERSVASASRRQATASTRCGPTERNTRREQLTTLIAERSDARIGFIKTRFHRDAAAVYCDSVVVQGPTITQPAWDSFSAMRTEMDIAGNHLYMSCAAIVDHVLSNV